MTTKPVSGRAMPMSACNVPVRSAFTSARAFSASARASSPSLRVRLRGSETRRRCVAPRAESTVARAMSASGLFWRAVAIARGRVAPCCERLAGSGPTGARVADTSLQRCESSTAKGRALRARSGIGDRAFSGSLALRGPSANDPSVVRHRRCTSLRIVHHDAVTNPARSAAAWRTWRAVPHHLELSPIGSSHRGGWQLDCGG